MQKKQEQIHMFLYGPLHMPMAVMVNYRDVTYNISAWIQDVVWKKFCE